MTRHHNYFVDLFHILIWMASHNNRLRYRLFNLFSWIPLLFLLRENAVCGLVVHKKCHQSVITRCPGSGSQEAVASGFSVNVPHRFKVHTYKHLSDNLRVLSRAYRVEARRALCRAECPHPYDIRRRNTLEVSTSFLEVMTRRNTLRRGSSCAQNS